MRELTYEEKLTWLEKFSDEHDIVSAVGIMFGNINVKFGLTQKMLDAKINELPLSVRAFNALMRSDRIVTIGDVANESGRYIRGLGGYSKQNIAGSLFAWWYDQIGWADRRKFLRNLIEENECLLCVRGE